MAGPARPEAVCRPAGSGPGGLAGARWRGWRRDVPRSPALRGRAVRSVLPGGVLDAHGRREGQHGRQQIRPGRVEPDHARIAAEPRLLPAREAPGGPDGLITRPRLRPLAGQEPQHLRVAEGAARGFTCAQPSGLQAAHLIDETGAPHSLDPGYDALVELFTRKAQADKHGHFAAGEDLIDARPGQSLILGHAGALPNVPDVK